MLSAPGLCGLRAREEIAMSAADQRLGAGSGYIRASSYARARLPTRSDRSVSLSTDLAQFVAGGKRWWPLEADGRSTGSRKAAGVFVTENASPETARLKPQGTHAATAAAAFPSCRSHDESIKHDAAAPARWRWCHSPRSPLSPHAVLLARSALPPSERRHAPAGRLD